VRRHLGLEHVDLIGHSYIGLVVALYAMRYPSHARRVVQIGPTQPEAGKKYPPELMCLDDVFAEVMTKIGALQQERATLAPIDFCRKFWEVLRPLYVADRANANRVLWDRCDLPNELSFMKYWMGVLQPSMQNLVLTSDMFAAVSAEVLTIHGRKDRSAPYGGGKDWAERLPQARLLTIDNGGHAPWIEAPDTVFEAIESFLRGDPPSS
jgi:pimeloyl-ACP methyl ester carboxylesterase